MKDFSIKKNFLLAGSDFRENLILNFLTVFIFLILSSRRFESGLSMINIQLSDLYKETIGEHLFLLFFLVIFIVNFRGLKNKFQGQNNYFYFLRFFCISFLVNGLFIHFGYLIRKMELWSILLVVLLLVLFFIYFCFICCSLPGKNKNIFLHFKENFILIKNNFKKITSFFIGIFYIYIIVFLFNYIVIGYLKVLFKYYHLHKYYEFLGLIKLLIFFFASVFIFIAIGYLYKNLKDNTEKKIEE